MGKDNRESGHRFFQYIDGEIRLKQSIVPSMFTTNSAIVHQDCLGYFMERFHPDFQPLRQ